MDTEGMKKILLIITGIILVVSIPVIVFYFGQQQELRSKAAPATTLAVTPNTVSSNPGETITFNIEIDTGENQVATAQLALLFDQTKAEALSITSGPLAPNILTQGITGPGTATITVGAKNTAQPIKGKGIIAIVRLKIADGASGSLSLQLAPSPTTFVGGLGENPSNVLIGITGAQITLSGTENITTPSLASPTAEPTVTAAPTSIPASLPENLINEPITTITVIVVPNVTTPTKPTIKGTTTPNATVTLVIQPEGKNAVVTADKNGNFIFTPVTALKTGEHTVIVTSVDTAGKTQSSSALFSINANVTEETATDEALLNAMPQSGSSLPLYIFLGLSFLLFTSSISMIYLKI